MGFTLMEMLVVVSLIALMSLFAWPRVITLYNQSSVRSARTAVRNLFEAGRMNARANNSRVTLTRNGNIFRLTNNTSGAVLGSVNVDGEFKVAASGDASIVIDARGLSTQARTFVFTRGAAADSVVISGYGRVTR
jgi:prepilin-type N-terminal cleavage/methylation domain-containing protein